MTQRTKILVIDDNVDLCATIAGRASRLGMECITTFEAKGFFEALTPDVTVVVLDLLMPNTDGIEILRILGHDRCQAGIILMSGAGERVIQTAEELATNLGLSIVGHLAKPFSGAQLEHMLLRTPIPATAKAPIQQLQLPFDRADIARAIKQEEFVLHYQPQIEIVSGRCLGVEAHARWQHPVHGLVYPENFIGLAEEFGLIKDLTWTIFEIGLTEMGKAIDTNGDPLSIAFNLSVLSLRDLAFPDAVIAMLKEFDVPIDRIILGVAETCLIREWSQILDVLTRLRMKGIRLSIDDFGTGDSMMKQLGYIPANELKMDRSLLQNLHADNHQVIIQKIIELAQELDFISVAEGVETREQLDFLRSKSCDIAQGSFFTMPIPKQEFITWLETYETTLKRSYSGRF